MKTIRPMITFAAALLIVLGISLFASDQGIADECYPTPPAEGYDYQSFSCCIPGDVNGDSLIEEDEYKRCYSLNDGVICPRFATIVTSYCIEVTREFAHPFSVWGVANPTNKLIIPQEMLYMNELGIKAFKSSVAAVWGLVYEKNLSSDYVWQFSDTVVDEAANHNIKPILTLSPLKNTGENNELPKTPEEMQAYKDYIQATVLRYKDKVDTWQIVNELSAHWTDTAENYAELVRITVEEVREIQPEAGFVLAAPATSLFGTNCEQDFLESVLIALEPYGNDWFDYLDIHFIGEGHPSENKHLEMIEWYSYFKEVLTAYGYNNVGYFAEINSYGGGVSDVSEREQAIDLLRKYFVGAALGFDQIHNNGQIIEEPLSIIAKHDIPEGRTYDALIYNPEVNVGMSSKKLAYYSLKKVIEKLEGFDSVQTIKENDNGIFIYKFIKQEKPIWVAWNDNHDPERVKITNDSYIYKVVITQAIPKYEYGEDVADYSTAFDIKDRPVQNNNFIVMIDENPVFIEAK